MNKKPAKSSEIQPKKFNFKKSLIALGIGAIIGAVVWLVLDRQKIHNVVCQVIGGDEQAGVFAARCMIK